MNQNVAVTQLQLDFWLADAIKVEPELDSDDIGAPTCSQFRAWLSYQELEFNLIKSTVTKPELFKEKT